MPLACPKCGSRFLRDSQARTRSERLSQLWFVSPLRCMDCKTRFITHTVIVRDLFYARCPRCFRMDLNAWTGKTYEPPFWMSVKIFFGGRRWRCEYCRLNFVSLRKRRESFSFGRWASMNAGQARAEGRAQADEKRAQAVRGTVLDEPELIAETVQDLQAPLEHWDENDDWDEQNVRQ